MAQAHTLEDLQTEQQEGHDRGEGHVLDDSIFDETTAFDFPRSDVLEWQSEDLKRRLGRLSAKGRTALKRKVTEPKKKILTNLLKGKFNKGKKGTLPYQIYEDVVLRYDRTTGQPNGLRYRGVLIMVRGENGGLRPNPNAKIAYPNFIRELNAARGLPETTGEGQASAKISDASGQLAPSPETVDSVRRDLRTELEEARDDVITPAPELVGEASGEVEKGSCITPAPDPPRRTESELSLGDGKGLNPDEEEDIEALHRSTTRDIRDRNLDAVAGWKVYHLRKKGVISNQEAREIRGSLLIDRNTMSEDPYVDELN